MSEYYKEGTISNIPATLGDTSNPTDADMIAAGYLRVVREPIAADQKAGPGYQSGEEWIIPAVAKTLDQLKEDKRQEILTAYTAADQADVTDSLGRAWPGGYGFVKIARDRRDFAAEFGGPSATITLRMVPGPQVNMTQAEASNLILELGMVAATNADRRDYLLDQINNAADEAALNQIVW